MVMVLSEEELDNEDYYLLLNVCREVFFEELKVVYWRFCMFYYLDKYRDLEFKL